MQNRLVILVIMAIGMTVGSSATDKEWMKNYGLNAECANPVFTCPERTVAGGRVEGAGINMNDGEAYTDYVPNLHRGWHYAPKLPISAMEIAQLRRVLGLSHLEEHAYEGVLAKLNVKQIGRCDAMVIYGVFDSNRDDGYMATYTSAGELVDVMQVGVANSVVDEMFSAESDGSFTSRPNMGGVEVVIDKADPSKFSIEMYKYYSDANGKSQKWEMTRNYKIDGECKICLVNVDEKCAPNFNAIAKEIFESRLVPYSRISDKLALVNKLAAKAGGDASVKVFVEEELNKMYAFDGAATLMWIWRCPKCNLTAEMKRQLRKRSYNMSDAIIPSQVAEDVAKLSHAKARSYWNKQLRNWQTY